MKDFGRLLRQARLALGLTQEELARRVGLSVRAVGDLERRHAITAELRAPGPRPQ